MKTLKEQTDELAKNFGGDNANSTFSKISQKLAIVAAISYNRALANIELDEGDLLRCCADYAELESEGGGTEGLSLKEMLSQAYYEGAKLAVERIKEGKWRK